MAKKVTKKASGRKSAGAGVIARRVKLTKDEVAEKLVKIDSIPDMITYGRKVCGQYADEESWERIEKAAKQGVQNGLLRMRIGNLIRGALRRKERGVVAKAGGRKSERSIDNRGQRKGKGARRTAGVEHVATPAETKFESETGVSASSVATDAGPKRRTRKPAVVEASADAPAVIDA
jgi:hypothetical protein